MKQISLDFKNRMLAIRTESQDGTEVMWEDIQKDILLDFIPKTIYMKGDNFTFDFENEIVSINQSVTYEGIEEGAIYTVDMFVSAEDYPIPGLSDKFYKMIDRMGYAETQWNEREMDYINTCEFMANIFNNVNL